MRPSIRIALLYLLLSGAASAAIQADFDKLPTNWTLSSGELPADPCTSGLCHSGERIAPPDDPVFQFANTAGATAAPVIAPRFETRHDGMPVPAGIGSVPEPQTYALLCGGLTLLGGLARRRPRA